MSEWTRAQEADFQTLIHRASEQSREYYLRRQDDEPAPPRPAPPRQPEHKAERCPEPQTAEIVCLPRKNSDTVATGSGKQGKTAIQRTTAVPPPQNRGASRAPIEGAGNKAAGRPSGKGNLAGGLNSIIEKLDNEGIMLAMLLWLLIEEKADNSIIIAIAYILLV